MSDGTEHHRGQTQTMPCKGGKNEEISLRQDRADDRRDRLPALCVNRRQRSRMNARRGVPNAARQHRSSSPLSLAAVFFRAE